MRPNHRPRPPTSLRTGARTLAMLTADVDAARARVRIEGEDTTRRPELVGTLMDLARDAMRGGVVPVSVVGDLVAARKALDFGGDVVGCLRRLDDAAASLALSHDGPAAA